MKIKTFYARTMAEALENIKASLGPEALILSTKTIARRSGAGGASGFQVVAATDSNPVPDVDGIEDSVGIASRMAEDDKLRPRLGGSRPAQLLQGAQLVQPDQAGGNRQAIDIYSPATLRSEVPVLTPQCEGNSGSPELREPVRRGASRTATPGVPTNAIARKLLQDLLANDVSQELALDLISQGSCQLSAEGHRPSRSGLTGAVADSLRRMLPETQQRDGLPLKQLVVFVGPAGVGKTTVIAKLAAGLSLMNRRKVALFTLDTYRIGAVDQLRSYASFMGLPFRVASETEELRKAINEHARRDYILIDTPGRFMQETEPVSDMIEFLLSTARSECHLVLSATTKTSDMERMAECYGECKPDYFVFTKLDETATFGSLLNEMVRTRKPVSYYSDGQRIPDDLHSVERERIIEIVLNSNCNGALTWPERLSPTLTAALTKTEARSRQTHNPPKPNPSPQTRR